MKDILSSKNNETRELYTFMAIWDDLLGPKVIDVYPHFNLGNLEELSIYIFQLYEFFYQNPDIPYHKAEIIVPIFKLNRKANVIFNSILNEHIRGGFQPYFIVLLAPDYFEDEELKFFNEILLKVSQNFLKYKTVSLENYYEEFKKILSLKIIPKDADVKISDTYSYSAAMEDFQAGITLYKQNNDEEAYSIFKKVLLKFEKEQHLNLMAEVLYLMGNLLVKKKNYAKAKHYFNQLNGIYERIQDKKYYEASLFMEAFAAYKLEDFISANRLFNNLKKINPKKINLIQFYTVFGKSLVHSNKFNEAFDMFNNALEKLLELQRNGKQKKQLSQVYYEMGNVLFRLHAAKINELGYIRMGEYQNYLTDALNFYINSEKILEELEDYSTLIHVLLTIGNLYEIVENENTALDYYMKTLEIIHAKNIPFNQLGVSKKVIQLFKKLKLHEKRAMFIGDILHDLERFGFIDSFSIASLYHDLAHSLIFLYNFQEGMGNLIIAEDILSKFDIPVHEELVILNQILSILTTLKQYDKIPYYSDRVKLVSERIHESEIQKPNKLHPLGYIKEIWIFSTISGVKLFSYAPETEMDQDLLGGFITALKNISVEIAQRELDSITIGNDSYTLFQEENKNFFILGRISSKTSIEITKKILKAIYKRFWKEFHDYIINFQGNITPFQRFEDIIDSLDLTLSIN